MSDMKWAPLVGATVVTKKQWETIPAEVRPALLESGAKAGKLFRTETRKRSVEAVDAMKKIKLNVHHAAPEDVAVWEKQARLAWPKLMGKAYPPELVAEIEKLLAEYRAAHGQAK